MKQAGPPQVLAVPMAAGLLYLFFLSLPLLLVAVIVGHRTGLSGWTLLWWTAFLLWCLVLLVDQGYRLTRDGIAGITLKGRAFLPWKDVTAVDVDENDSLTFVSAGPCLDLRLDLFRQTQGVAEFVHACLPPDRDIVLRTQASWRPRHMGQGRATQAFCLHLKRLGRPVAVKPEASAPSVVGVGFCLVLAVGFGWLATALMAERFALARYGQVAEAVVRSHEPDRCSRKSLQVCHYHRVEADGKSFRVLLDAAHARGEKVVITYLPHDVGVARAGRVEKGIWTFVRLEVGWIEGALLVLTLALLGEGVRETRKLLAARRSRYAAPQGPTLPTEKT